MHYYLVYLCLFILFYISFFGAAGTLASIGESDGLKTQIQLAKELNLKVPDVLLSGHHKKIEDWHNKMREEKTKEVRPDIWKKYKR